MTGAAPLDSDPDLESGTRSEIEKDVKFLSSSDLN